MFDAPALKSSLLRDGDVGDDTTNVNTLALSQTGVTDDTIRLFEGNSPQGTPTAVASGTSSFTTGNLPDDTMADFIVSSALTITSFSPGNIAAGEGITQATEATLSGTSAPDSIVTVFDEGTRLGVTKTESRGTWSLTIPALTSGSHSFTATATNAIGNTGAASSPFNVLVNAKESETQTLAVLSAISSMISDPACQSTPRPTMSSMLLN